jgi:hypothetical protein
VGFQVARQQIAHARSDLDVPDGYWGYEHLLGERMAQSQPAGW